MGSGTFPEQEDGSYRSIAVGDNNFPVDRARSSGSKREGYGAGTAGRKSRVGAVLPARPKALKFEDFDVLSSVISDGDLQRGASVPSRKYVHIVVVL